jgi:hypothetical protein
MHEDVAMSLRFFIIRKGGEKGMRIEHEKMQQIGPPEIFDNTMLGTWATCPRRFFYFHAGLRSKGTPLYFTYGRAIGAALNVWHPAKDTEWQPPEMRQMLGVAAIRKVYEEEQVGMPVDDSINGLQACENTFLLYCTIYAGRDPWKTIKGEVGFNLPVPHTSFSYAGAMDAYIEWQPHGLLVREDKSTGAWIGPSYLDQFRQSTQVTGYYWALRETIGEEPFGVLVNAIGKRKRKDPLEQFSRWLEKRDEGYLELFLRETVLLVDDIRREWDRWEWPKYGERNPMNCSGGMGKSACPYRQLCILPVAPWHEEFQGRFSLEEHYTMRSWSPWERAGEVEE